MVLALVGAGLGLVLGGGWVVVGVVGVVWVVVVVVVVVNVVVGGECGGGGCGTV